MFYRVVYWLLALVLAFAWVRVLILVVESDTSVWAMVPLILAYVFFPKEWLAEKISRQPRVDPFGRREGNAAEG